MATCCAAAPAEGGAGHQHVHLEYACLAMAQEAQVMPKLWQACPKCEQDWTGALRLALARTVWELAGGLFSKALVIALRLYGSDDTD